MKWTAFALLPHRAAPRRGPPQGRLLREKEGPAREAGGRMRGLTGGGVANSRARPAQTNLVMAVLVTAMTKESG